MKKILVELWNGNLNPCEWRTENSPEQGKLLELLEKNNKKLSEELNEEQRKILASIDDCHFESQYISCEDAFVKGFSLGVKMMVEVLGG